MGIASVVIVGRPNVGKSSIFNWLSQRRLAVVDDRPGVTRDRVDGVLDHDDKYFEIVDTGGMGIDDEDNLTAHIQEQISLALDSASVVVFVVDTRSGLLPLDEQVARRLRTISVPVICVANKTDDHKFDADIEQFRKLGFGDVLGISTLQNRNRDPLLEAIVENLPPLGAEQEDAVAEPEMKLAIVGRRNVGKSTFVNTLVQAQRMIVSEVPGTTRDSVDVRFQLDGKSFVAIDTPGLRRTKSLASDVEYYGTHRAKRSIRRADVVLLLFDCSQRISKVDKQLCDYVVENHKPCILVVNKWDLLAKEMPTEHWVQYLHDTFRTMNYAPIAFITGQTGKNVKALLNHAQMIFKQSRRRVTTGELNRIVQTALQHNPPPVVKHRRPKIFYATQVAVQPPTIVLFCNDPAAFSAPYRRYLIGFFRDHLPYAEVPIKLYLRRRSATDQRNEVDADSTPPQITK